jgi:hypothetical protein
MTAYASGFDRFQGVAADAIMPARRAFAVVTSDTKDLTDPTGDADPFYAKGLFVGGAGTVKVTMAGDVAEPSTPVTFSGVAAGTFLNVQVRRVWATGTTATLILALMD